MINFTQIILHDTRHLLSPVQSRDERITFALHNRNSLIGPGEECDTWFEIFRFAVKKWQHALLHMGLAEIERTDACTRRCHKECEKEPLMSWTG